MTIIERLLSALFKREEINGGKRCPTYLHRWTIWQPRRPRKIWRGFGIYLHKFVGDDWSRDHHDHPKRFISIGLRGRYIESTPSNLRHELLRISGGFEPQIYPCGCSHLKVEAGLCGDYSDRVTTFTAPWVRTFPAEHIHRLMLFPDRRPCWTLVVVLWTVREWGFWHLGEFWPWRIYVHPDNGTADKQRTCV